MVQRGIKSENERDEKGNRETKSVTKSDIEGDMKWDWRIGIKRWQKIDELLDIRYFMRVAVKRFVT